MIRSLPTIVAALVLIVGGAPSYVASQGEDVLAQARAWPHGEALELPGAHETVAEFTLPADHTRPVYLYLQAILRYRALSHSAGVLRFAVNDAPLDPEHSVNKAAEWCPAPQGPYAARASPCPPSPALTRARARSWRLGYLFDITDLARPGANTLHITHVAATDAALLRDAALIVGGNACR